MPKCKICGARIEDGVTECPSCGAKVVSSSAGDAGTNAGTGTSAGTMKPRVSSTTQVIKTTCPSCGTEVIGEHRFCPQCGVNLKEAAEEKKAASQPQERRCPSCGSVIQQNARFCPDCGKSIEPTIKTQSVAVLPKERLCPSCGSAIVQENASFCPVCGIKLMANINPPAKATKSHTDFVLVEGGSFVMGNKDEYDGNPVHATTVDSFYMCIHQVTQDEYQAVMSVNPSKFNGSNRPVESVTWYAAVTYCNKRSLVEGLAPCYSGDSETGYTCNFQANGYRLPTDAEWEYAAKDGKHHSPYRYSGSDDIEKVAWYLENSGYKTHDVMIKSPNALGLYDMTGNISEWCWDKRNDSSTYRVSRGGSHNCYAGHCTVFFRYSIRPSNEHNDQGFRVVRSAQ